MALTHSKDAPSMEIQGSTLAPAEVAKKLRVSLQHARLRYFVHSERPLVLFKRSAQQNSVRTRKHVELIIRSHHVIHFRLRQQECQLALCGSQLLIVEERSRPHEATNNDRLAAMISPFLPEMRDLLD